MTPTWTESYNCHTLRLSSGLYVHVDWTKEGYKVHFNGVVLKKRFDDLAEAKAAAVMLANRCMERALEELLRAPKES